MSLMGFKRFVAVFLDSNNDIVGQKTFMRTLGSNQIGHSKKVFYFKDNAYNIKPKSARFYISSASLLFDTYLYIYRIDNPDPYYFNEKDDLVPMFDANLYRTLLENKQTVDLIKAGRGSFKLDWRIILGLVVAVIVLYLIFGPKDSSAVQAVNNTINSTMVSVPAVRNINVVGGVG